VPQLKQKLKVLSAEVKVNRSLVLSHLAYKAHCRYITCNSERGARETTMSQITPKQETLVLKMDSGMFSIGFAVGLIIGKLVLRNTMMAIAFATGLGLAVGTSANARDEQSPSA
jgi:hypothetical protein